MRAELRQSVEVVVPAPLLWAYVTDWKRQSEWVPLTRAEVLEGTGHRVGDRIRAWTGVGPVGFWDTMTVTAWEDHDQGGRCEVLHTGRVVRGDGELRVEALAPGRSRFDWWERAAVPGGPLGGLAWRVVGPVVDAGIRAGLRRMAARLEATRG